MRVAKVKISVYMYKWCSKVSWEAERQRGGRRSRSITRDGITARSAIIVIRRRGRGRVRCEAARTLRRNIGASISIVEAIALATHRAAAFADAPTAFAAAVR